MVISRVSLRFVWSLYSGPGSLPLWISPSQLFPSSCSSDCPVNEFLYSWYNPGKLQHSSCIVFTHSSWGCLESSLTPQIHKNRKSLQGLFLYSQVLNPTWSCFFSVTPQCLQEVLFYILSTVWFDRRYSTINESETLLPHCKDGKDWGTEFK